MHPIGPHLDWSKGLLTAPRVHPRTEQWADQHDKYARKEPCMDWSTWLRSRLRRHQVNCNKEALRMDPRTAQHAALTRYSRTKTGSPSRGWFKEPQDTEGGCDEAGPLASERIAALEAEISRVRAEAAVALDEAEVTAGALREQLETQIQLGRQLAAELQAQELALKAERALRLKAESEVRLVHRRVPVRATPEATRRTCSRAQQAAPRSGDVAEAELERRPRASRFQKKGTSNESIRGTERAALGYSRSLLCHEQITDSPGRKTLRAVMFPGFHTKPRSTLSEKVCCRFNVPR